MKYILSLLLISTLFSCQSRKAKDYVALVDSADQKMFRLLTDKNVEDKRLQALIDDKADLALQLAKKQAGDIRSIIGEIENAAVDELPDAAPFKKSTTAYYELLLRLKEMDVEEAQLMSAALSRDTIIAQQANAERFQLARRRVEIHGNLNRTDLKRADAKAKFEKANGID